MSLEFEVMREIIASKKFEVINEYVAIVHPNRNERVSIDTYDGDRMRMWTEYGVIHIACPKQMTEVQECGLATALSTGSIFDDAETVDNSANYVMLRVLPQHAMAKCGCKEPCGMRPVVGATIGAMDDETGRCDVCDTDIENGIHLVGDLMHHPEKKNNVEDVVNNYLGDKSDDIYDKEDILEKHKKELKKDLKEIKDVDAEDELDDEDSEEIDMDDDEEEEDGIKQEGFLTKKPKKLKPIPRDIIAYITSEMHGIQTTNDQAMLSGYTCSKLELVDFYLNILDANDGRYIVPHNREYLVQMQNELNSLLTQILKIIPVNHANRIWRANVTAPETWR